MNRHMIAKSNNRLVTYIEGILIGLHVYVVRLSGIMILLTFWLVLLGCNLILSWWFYGKV